MVRACPRLSPGVGSFVPSVAAPCRWQREPDGCPFLPRMMWAAGAVAAMSSITFPAISAMVSRNADPDQQGESLGVGLTVSPSRRVLPVWGREEAVV